MGIQTRVVNIPGNAGTVTNGVYTSGDQTIGGIKTFSAKINLPAVAESWIEAGTGDNATRTTYNVAFKSWFGLAFKGYDNTVNRVLDCRTGEFKSNCGAAFLMEYVCRAWVNFNGTGTVAIRGAGNVSSITDNGTGDYTVNFTNAMPDANFAVSRNATNPGRTEGWSVGVQGQSANAVRLVVKPPGYGIADMEQMDVMIFR